MRTNEWFGLDTYIKDGRNPEYRTLMNNTVAIRRGEDIAVKLHNTDVLTFHTDGTVTYNTGGWYTVTTKSRFNEFGPDGFRVYSDKGTWTLYGLGNSHRFFDGLRLNPETGEIVNPEDGPDFDSIDAENKALGKRISEYVKLYTDDRIQELISDARERGTKGDCLPCQLGPEPAMGTDHFESHFEEGYVMASVMLNSYRFKGYGDPALVLMLDAERTPKDVRAHIRKFLRAQLVKPEGN